MDIVMKGNLNIDAKASDYKPAEWKIAVNELSFVGEVMSPFIYFDVILIYFDVILIYFDVGLYNSGVAVSDDVHPKRMGIVALFNHTSH